jgi:hypothetical protein
LISRGSFSRLSSIPAFNSEKVRAILMVEFETVSSLYAHAITDVLKRVIDHRRFFGGYERDEVGLRRSLRYGNCQPGSRET